MKACLGLRTKVNGLPIYDLCCADCGRRVRHLSAKAFNELIKRGKRVEYVESRTGDIPVCMVRGCTTVGYEYHHFAPRNVFGFDEANRWPYLRLCKPHHTAWHQEDERVPVGSGELPAAVPEPMPCLIYKCSQPGTRLLRLAPKSRFPHSDDWPVVPGTTVPTTWSTTRRWTATDWSRKADSSEFNLDTIGEWFDGYRYWASLEPYLRGAH